jgi:hypothetical protein
MSDVTTLFKKQQVIYTTEVFENYNKIPTVKKDSDPMDISMDIFTHVSSTPIRSFGTFTLKYATHDENLFLENYGTPLASVHMRRKTLVIEETENKIALKIYSYNNIRDVSKRFFRVRREISYLTFNVKRKTFYSGILILKKRAKVGSKMSTYRTDLNTMEVINSLRYFNMDPNPNYCADPLYDEVTKIFLDRVAERMDVKFDNEDMSPEDKFYQLYLKFSGIKYPDAFSKFKSYYTPKKEIRESGNNLVTWFMTKHKFKGTKIRTLLNKYNNVDLRGVNEFYSLLGQDLFNKVNNECFLNDTAIGEYFNEVYTTQVYDLSKKERENIVKILNTTTTNTLLNSLYDHIRYKSSLARYGENVKILATNYDDYVVEHTEWSTIVQSYRTGLVNRFYGDDAYLIEKPIIHDGETYYPVLLKTTEQYECESMVQNNCVRTYSEKPYCFIVSLRKGNVNGNDRASVELRYSKDGLKVMQKLGRFNKPLTDEWISPINELEGFAKYLYGKDIIKLPLMEKRFPNGKVVKTLSIFKNDDMIKNMYPIWNNGNCALQENMVDYNLLDDF